MEIRNLDLKNNHEVSFVENLYIESFPLSERRPVETMFDLYKENSPFVISVTIEDDNLVGFLTYWDLDDFIFAEHFAISPEFRNGGYGRKVMELFKTNMVKPIVLEVELPATILSERRIGFYQRLGFKLWENIQYQQPAYYEHTGAIPMKLMSYGDIDVEKELVEIKGKIYSIVYEC
ncbi:ribosomal protein S18 acetylase RimI-like enzyme [Dysgonomonas hofstadii]|uniref:Ribosomal protein S18 acetylase RimI-like enzyme n=1 Tax=Dysgonomonas hofstadii TaxID=637886 RepID=A0A840CIF2_9BACT|nr:GNAT family N-acetyltransferase [Dysgonomonas hofstadii]MBB4035096.1 ribosomal protein S18 acetylase RimI-like enzyme [Dysgonomonas hofstadii]